MESLLTRITTKHVRLIWKQTFAPDLQLEGLISKIIKKMTKLFGSKAFATYFCDPNNLDDHGAFD
jgi:hypothetical protein